MLVRVPQHRGAVAPGNELVPPVVAVGGEGVEVPVDAPVRTLPPHKHLADAEGLLAEVGRVDALLAQALP